MPVNNSCIKYKIIPGSRASDTAIQRVNKDYHNITGMWNNILALSGPEHFCDEKPCTGQLLSKHYWYDTLRVIQT